MIRILLCASLLFPTFRVQEAPPTQDPDEKKGQFLGSGEEFNLDMVRTMRSMQEHVQMVSRRSQKECEDSLKENGFTLVNGVLTPEGSGGRAYVAVYQNNLVIAFRGSKSANAKEFTSNILSDLDIRRKKMDWISGESRNAGQYRKIRVHRGFAMDYTRFRTGVLKAVNENPKKNLFVFGHSLGAALASLCAFDIEVSLGRDVHLYISGGPRVGGDKFREAFEAEIKLCVRMTVGDDPFPRIPPRKMGYTHVGQLLALKRDGTILPAAGIKANTSLGSFADHNNKLYRDVVQKFLDHCRKNPDLLKDKKLLHKAAGAERVSKE